MVREGQSLGVFDPELDPYLSAKSVWAASHGLAQLMTHLPNFPALLPTDRPVSASAFIAFHADLVFRGLQSPDEARHPEFTPED